MSTPKKDWIFTAVLVVLIAVLSAVVAMRLMPGGSESKPEPDAAVTADETSPTGEEGVVTTPAAGETLYSPATATAASPAGAETAYSPAAKSPKPAPAAKTSAAKTPRVVTVRTGDTNYSPTGQASRPGATGTEEVATATEADPFPYLGMVNPFDPIVTPTPTPTPLPPPTPQPNNLNRALQNWVLEYPLKHGSQWVFSDRVKKDQTYTVEVGQKYHLKDITDFDADVSANGKWGVQFDYQGQNKKYSMVEP